MRSANEQPFIDVPNGLKSEFVYAMVHEEKKFNIVVRTTVVPFGDVAR